MGQCERCGKIFDRAKVSFCPHCGTSAREGSAADAGAGAGTSTSIGVIVPHKDKLTPRHTRGLIIGLIGCAVLVAGVILLPGWFKAIPAALLLIGAALLALDLF